MERVSEKKSLIGFSCGQQFIITPKIAFKVNLKIFLFKSLNNFEFNLYFKTNSFYSIETVILSNSLTVLFISELNLQYFKAYTNCHSLNCTYFYSNPSITRTFFNLKTVCLRTQLNHNWKHSLTISSMVKSYKRLPLITYS